MYTLIMKMLDNRLHVLVMDYSPLKFQTSNFAYEIQIRHILVCYIPLSSANKKHKVDDGKPLV